MKKIVFNFLLYFSIKASISCLPLISELCNLNWIYIIVIAWIRDCKEVSTKRSFSSLNSRFFSKSYFFVIRVVYWRTINNIRCSIKILIAVGIGNGLVESACNPFADGLIHTLLPTITFDTGIPVFIICIGYPLHAGVNNIILLYYSYLDLFINYIIHQTIASAAVKCTLDNFRLKTTTTTTIIAKCSTGLLPRAISCCKSNRRFAIRALSSGIKPHATTTTTTTVLGGS